MRKLFIALALTLLIAVNVNAQTGGNLMNIIPAADCSWLTFDGFLCQDTDDHKLYKWNGATQIELAGGADAASLQGYAVGATAPTSTYVLTWDGDSWEPAAAPGAGTGAATTLGYITWQTEASLSAERVLTESTGIDLSTAIANQIIVSVNTTEIGTTTWGVGGASYVWIYNVSGTTDPVLTISDGVFNVSAGTIQQAGTKVALGIATSTDNRLVRWDSTGGQQLQTSAITVDDTGNVTGMGTLSVGEVTASGAINDVTISDPGTGATLTLADGSSLITIGGYAVTLTATTATGVTFPSSGTLYGTASGSITSAQLATSLTNETGTTLAVFSDSPTFTDDITLGAAGVKLGGATGILTLAGVGGTYNENLIIDFEPATDTQTIDISSGTGATTIDFGSLIVGVGALDVSDGNITNVGNIALDSISNDGTSITIIASDAGTVTVESVVFTSGALTGVTSINDGTALWSSSALSGFSTIANTGNITTGGDLIAADGNTDFIIQSDNETSDTVKIQVRDTTDAGAWDDILVATSGADPTLALTADGAISVVSSGSTVTVESVIFTGGAISSATTIAMGGALSGVTTATLTHTAPDITLTDSDDAAGTGNLLFASANVQDVVGTIQADIAGSATTFLSIDGVNEEVLFGKKADLATLGIENVGALAGVTTITATGDVSITDAVNDGNPVFAIGSGANERLSITATYEAGGQLLESVTFATVTEDTDADDGEMIFSVDGTTIMTIKDGGVSFVGDVLLPSTNADPAAVAGALRHDSTVSNFTNGALVYYNGAAIKQIVDMTTATASACTEAQVIVYDATADLWKCADAPAADADIVAIAALTVAQGKFIIGNADPAWSLSAYALPITAGTENQILKVAAGGALVWAADADTGGATEINNLGDASGAGVVLLGDTETMTFITSSDGETSFLFKNDDADLAGVTSIIDLAYNDDGQANGFFMRGYDNAYTDLKWSIGADGAVTFGTGAFTSITASTTIEAEGVITAGTSHTALTDSAGKILSAALNTVGIGQGGTGSTAAATTNGIVYGASATAYGLTAAATVEGQILRAGVSPFIPAWSTATYPATATTNGILYAASATGFSQITTGVSGVLVTDGSGVPSISTTLPAVTLTTPVLGDATATYINDVAITDPGTIATLTLADGSTLTTVGAYALTLTATTASNATLPAGTKTLAANDQTMYIGTTAVAINRTTAALELDGITTINDLTISDPGTGATLTLADGGSLITVGAYALTLTATTASNVTFPSTGTLLANALTSAYVFVGNGSNVATGVAVTGDVTITNAGVTAIGADKIKDTMVDWGAGAGQINLDDIDNSATWSKVVTGDLDESGHPIRLYDIDSSTYITINGLATTVRAVTIQDVAGQTLANLGTAQTFSASNTFTPVQYFGGAAAAGSLRIYDGSDNYVTLSYPTSGATTTFAFPLVAGTTGYFLQTDGAGNTSWSVTGIVTTAGDCTGGACFDGSSDGGTYISFYDAQGLTKLQVGNNAAEVTLTLPITTGTLMVTGGTGNGDGLIFGDTYPPDAVGEIGYSTGVLAYYDGTASRTVMAELRASGGLIFGDSTPDTEGEIGYASDVLSYWGTSATRSVAALERAQTFTANNVFGDADTDTLTLRSLLIGGNSRALWIAATAPTPTYATTSDDVYVAGNVEVAGIVYAASFNAGAGTDGQRGITLTSNTALTPTTDQIYFINDVLYFSQAGAQKTPMRLEDAQTATGLKTFEAGVYLGDADTAGVFKIADGSTNYWVIASPSIAADMTLTLPTDAGATGKYLKTTTTGNSAVLSWDTPTSAADTTGGTGGVQFNAAGVMLSDAGFVFTTATDKLTLGSSGGATTGTIDLYYTGTTYAATITPNASMSGDVTITLPPSTGTLIGTGANTFTGAQTLKAGEAGVGGAPLYFQTGTNLTSAAAGAMEFNGTTLFFSPSTTRYAIPLGPAAGPITFAGPSAARTITFPDAAITVARTDAENTFTGVQTMTSAALTTPVVTTDIHAATAGGATVGTNALPFSGVRIGNAATNNILLTGTSASDITITLPSATGTLPTLSSAPIFTSTVTAPLFVGTVTGLASLATTASAASSLNATALASAPIFTSTVTAPLFVGTLTGLASTATTATATSGLNATALASAPIFTSTVTAPLFAGTLTGAHNGTVGATTPATGVFTTLQAASTTSLTVGSVTGPVKGDITFYGATSGTSVLSAQDAAGAGIAVRLPASAGTLAILGANAFTAEQTITKTQTTDLLWSALTMNNVSGNPQAAAIYATNISSTQSTSGSPVMFGVEAVVTKNAMADTANPTLIAVYGDASYAPAGGSGDSLIYGGKFSATGDTTNTSSTTYGIYATASGADTNWAGYFNGPVLMTGTVTAPLFVGTVTGTASGNMKGTAGATANALVKRGADDSTVAASTIVEDGTDINAAALNLISTGAISGGIKVVTVAVATTIGVSPLTVTTDRVVYGGVIVATTGLTLQIPALTAGMSVCVYSVQALPVVINPDDGDIITLNGTATTAGDSITSASGAGDFICLLGVSASSWLSLGRSGTWTDTN